MKKFKAIALLLAAVLALSCMGCGNSEGDSTQEINGFQKANYKKYSAESHDELKGNLIYLDGIVDSQSTMKEEESGVDVLLLHVKQNKKEWLVLAYGTDGIDGIEGKEIRAFGTYSGISGKYDAPVLEVAADDEMYLSYARIDLNSDGNYQTVWKYSDYLEQLELLAAGQKLLAEEKYEFDGKPVSVKLIEDEDDVALSFSATVADEDVIPFFTYQIYFSYWLMTSFNKLEKPTARLDLLLFYGNSGKSEFFSGTNMYDTKVRLNGQDSSEEMQSVQLYSESARILTEEEAHQTAAQISEMLEKAKVLVAETEYTSEANDSNKEIVAQKSFEFEGETVDVGLAEDRGNITVCVLNSLNDTEKISIYVSLMFYWFGTYRENADKSVKTLGLFVVSEYPHRSVICSGENLSSFQVFGFNEDRTPCEWGDYPDWFEVKDLSEERKDYAYKLALLAKEIELWIDSAVKELK